VALLMPRTSSAREPQTGGAHGICPDAGSSILILKAVGIYT
jgi:hypothetical protein